MARLYEEQPGKPDSTGSIRADSDVMEAIGR